MLDAFSCFNLSSFMYISWKKDFDYMQLCAKSSLTY